MTNPANIAAPHADAILRTGPSGSAAVVAVQLTPTGNWQEVCVCGHPHTHHDAIGLRYCAATISGSMTRGCICAARPTRSPDATRAG